jgi:hypothetical protein
MRLFEHLNSMNEAVKNFKVAFVEDKNFWKLVKKYWPEEAKELEKGYNEKLMDHLKDSVIGSISRYGLK